MFPVNFPSGGNPWIFTALDLIPCTVPRRGQAAKILLATPGQRWKIPHMNLADARSAVILAIGRMNALYQKPLFDEWVLVKLAREEEGAILAYHGARAESYQRRFKTDIAPLQVEMEGRKMAVGDFEFAPNAHGAHFDACIRLGRAAYLFCNHTGKSMNELRADPQWLEAQKAFLDLAQEFRDDPLE
jgi:hypothetical protein